MSASRVRDYLGDAYTQPTWPRNYQAEHLEATVRQAQALGVPIVFVEMPVHDLLIRMMPAFAQEKFLRYMESVAQRQGVRFVSAEHLGESFERADFSEQSHLNYRGAKKYTNAIAPIISKALAEQPGKK